jgi:hypothetical protein
MVFMPVVALGRKTRVDEGVLRSFAGRLAGWRWCGGMRD